ncbi:MAG: hypothetical protein QM704_02360 [Anaeromyxobacteraceae bacterium]
MSLRTVAVRRLLRALHRDVGYLVAGLTVIYAVSGVAVNHLEHWNPSWQLGREELRFAPIPVTDRDTMAAALVTALGLPGPPRSSFRRAPEQIELFYDGWTVEANVETGVAVTTRPRERAVLFDANFLHLNHPKGAWTWIADAFAVLLGGLALSGLFLIRGPLGLAGRGKWFVAAGVLLPLAFLVLRRL